MRGCVLACSSDDRIMMDHPKLRIGLNEVKMSLSVPIKVSRLKFFQILNQTLPRNSSSKSFKTLKPKLYVDLRNFLKNKI